MRDGGAHIAKVCRFGKNVHVINHFPSRCRVAFHFKRQHRAARALLFFHQRCLRVFRQPRVIHLAHLRLLLQPLRNFQRGSRRRIGAQNQRFHAAQQHPSVKRRQAQPHRVHIHSHLRNQILLAAHNAAQHAPLSINGFGARLHAQIRAQAQRLLHGGRTKAVIHHQQRLDFMRDLRQGFNIRHFAQGVRRRFQEKHFGIRADGFAPFVHIGLRNQRNFNTKARQHGNQPCRCAKQAAAAD